MNKRTMLLAGAAICSSAVFAQFSSDYAGTPYNGPHNIPGTLQAEDFDNGGEGVSWHDTSTATNNFYRSTNVNIEQYSGYTPSIGFTSNGEWLNYTIEVAQDGAYEVKTYCTSGNDSGSFHLEVDGRTVTRATKVPANGWSNFNGYAVNTIQLKAGKHLFRWYTYGGMNLDLFIFTRTGDYNENDILGNFNYPITKESHNPLFANFDSPMYGGSGIGTMYTADPSAHVYKDAGGNERLYVYASHDMEPARGCDHMDRYHIFSTDDMVNWTDHGEAFAAKDVPWGRIPAGDSGEFMWAPDCAYKNGTYYFYFPHPQPGDWNDNWRLGVATGSSPTGPWSIMDRPIDGVPGSIDPCVFIDDDGQAYLYIGGGGICYGGKLADDMVSVAKDSYGKTESFVVMQGLDNFHEGSWVHKYNGKYYLSYADNNGHDWLDGNQLRYAVSDSPLGPWESKGAYLLPTGCDTSHGSIVEFKGQWYAFYHASNVSGTGPLRNVCVDKLEYRPDDTIKYVHNWGDPYGQIPEIKADGARIEAESYNDGGYHTAYFKRERGNKNHSNGRAADDVEIAGDNGTYVKDLKRGEWLRYSVKVSDPDTYDVTFRVNGRENSNVFCISPNGNALSGRISAPQGWQEVTVKNLVIKDDIEYLDLRVAEGSVDIDWIQINPASPYEGTVFGQGNHNVPGIIQAEDFDNGGEGIAYYNGTTGNQNPDRGYRPEADLERDDMGGWHLCWMSDGKWFKYTVNAEKDGFYDVTALVSNQAGGGADVRLSCKTQEIVTEPYTGIGWGNFSEIKFNEPLYLKKGQNVLEMRAGMNVDWLKFALSSSTPSGVEVIQDPDMPVNVCTPSGVMLRRQVPQADALEGLPAGIYIVGNRKVIKKP